MRTHQKIHPEQTISKVPRDRILATIAGEKFGLTGEAMTTEFESGNIRLRWLVANVSSPERYRAGNRNS